MLASCVFYAAFIPAYILILFFTIIIDYVAGILIEKTEGPKRKWYLTMSIIANVGVLAIFKYYNFFIGNINDLLLLIGIHSKPLPYLGIILPIGLSFHTFQAMSYTIEVYRKNQPAEKHFGIYSLYVMFYPQLVAGPIERPQNVIHQFYEEKKFDYSLAVKGIRLMLIGMFKKVVIADRLALFTNPVFNDPNQYSSVILFMGAVFFAFQIFCDFSGYSDIALGSAQVMGITLMKNFDKPYHSQSISEFWSRWHISLSTWFRDYLYITLGGNRVSVPRWYFNLFFVFLVSGFWHGANWTFIIWGMLHGFYLIFALATSGSRKTLAAAVKLDQLPRIQSILNILITFVLVTIAWIFFRANTVKEAMFIVTSVLHIPLDILSGSGNLLSKFPVTSNTFLISVVMIIFLETYHTLLSNAKVISLFSKPKSYLRWSVYYMLIIGLVFLGVWGEQQFIYFQF